MTYDGHEFTLKVSQNPCLAVGSTTVHAIVRVSAAGGDSDSRPPTVAEVIVIDKSLSMRGSKITAARQAAAAAVEVLRDGTHFAVVAGQSRAEQVYPEAGMVTASAATREEAVAALNGVRADGATNMSTWLRHADLLLSESDAQLKHVLFLTDGQNIEGEGPLGEALRACENHFVCDCRGVGNDWHWKQLKEIAGTLRGSWKPIEAEGQLAEDFRSVMRTSMRKRVVDARLRVRMPPGARVVHFAQVMPTVEKLTDRITELGGRTVEFPLGAWGDEVRDYDIRIEVEQEDLGVENDTKAGAGRLEVMVPTADGGFEIAAKRPIFVTWTTDPRPAMRIDPEVARYTGAQDLAQAVKEGLNAQAAGAPDAEAKLGVAVALAHRLGRDELLERLAAFVRIEDPGAGRVSLLPRDRRQDGYANWSKYLSELSDPDQPGSEAR